MNTNKELQKKDAEDWAGVDTYVRIQACKVFTKDIVYGDSNMVLTISDLVKEIVDEVKRLRKIIKSVKITALSIPEINMSNYNENDILELQQGLDEILNILKLGDKNAV